MHILHTVLYTFSMVLTKRVCFNQEFLEWVVFSFILIASMFDSGGIRIFALLEDKRFIHLMYCDHSDIHNFYLFLRTGHGSLVQIYSGDFPGR